MSTLREEPEQSSPESGAVIVATKLYIPPRRAGLVPREALVSALVAGAGRRLTLVDAPPGSGKTTLLSEWHAAPSEHRPFAWVSLDEHDNDPAHFWDYVVEALRMREVAIGEGARQALHTPGTDLVGLTLPLLINELALIPREMVLVLDDYHVITNEAVHRSVAFLLDHLPASLHVAIATRADPPLPLGRLRSRGDLTEIRAADLRFSEAEAVALLNGSLRLDLDAGDIDRLQRRTEGWAAGLYLAALSLRGRSDPSKFIDSFAGDDRHILDYLLSEVLAGQSDEIRAFLLRTSILDRLCGSLCDAVTHGHDSSLMLELIERSNLFLVPLDTKRVWYRYHHLFADLLRHELLQSSPGEAPELHDRAYRWYRARGSISEAIEHGAAAGQTEAASELIAEHWNQRFNQGNLSTVRHWLDSVGEETVRKKPQLGIAAAWLAMDAGRAKEAASWIESAESAIARAGRRGKAAALIGVEIEAAVLRAVQSFKVGDVGRAHESARHVIDLEPEQESFARTVACCILGITHFWQGRTAPALEALERAQELARLTENDLALNYTRGYSAVVLAEIGDLDEAERAADLALALADERGFVEHFVTMMGHLGRGLVLERRGLIDLASESLERAVELSSRGASAIETGHALVELVHARQLQGETQEASALGSEARAIFRSCADPGTATETIASTERALRRVVRSRDGVEGASEADELTDRELAVLRLLESKLSQREIGAALYVSLNTVKTHARGIYRKLDASTREEAVARAHKLGLL